MIGTRLKQKYNRSEAEKRFARVYSTAPGDRCIYCGMPNDGKFDHQPPVYILHRFANGGLVTKKQIQEHFGQCKLVPCCTICNMGLGAYHGLSDRERRAEIVNWFLEDERFPEDKLILALGCRLIGERLKGKRDRAIYEFPGVGRIIYMNALMGLIEGDFQGPHDFPDWLRLAQSELSDWLRGAPKRKARYFLDMAKLESYELLPHARSDPRGQFE
ncbi:hypothetical protein [Rhizobium mesoamericanum]|uniref:hypothetical protein n=1 Tax=Rhizobium mesoamericanum TaxID=1079800 RepID=UPI0012DF3417|nr:hypothetical protein [Rhizobium mesoamericanum]